MNYRKTAQELNHLYRKQCYEYMYGTLLSTVSSNGVRLGNWGTVKRATGWRPRL